MSSARKTKSSDNLVKEWQAFSGKLKKYLRNKAEPGMVLAIRDMLRDPQPSIQEIAKQYHLRGEDAERLGELQKKWGKVQQHIDAKKQHSPEKMTEIDLETTLPMQYLRDALDSRKPAREFQVLARNVDAMAAKDEYKEKLRVWIAEQNAILTPGFFKEAAMPGSAPISPQDREGGYHSLVRQLFRNNLNIKASHLYNITNHLAIFEDKLKQGDHYPSKEVIEYYLHKLKEGIKKDTGVSLSKYELDNIKREVTQLIVVTHKEAATDSTSTVDTPATSTVIKHDSIVDARPLTFSQFDIQTTPPATSKAMQTTQASIRHLYRTMVQEIDFMLKLSLPEGKQQILNDFRKKLVTEHERDIRPKLTELSEKNLNQVYGRYQKLYERLQLLYIRYAQQKIEVKDEPDKPPTPGKRR